MNNNSSKVSRINTCSTDIQQEAHVNNNQNEKQSVAEHNINTFTKPNDSNK